MVALDANFCPHCGRKLEELQPRKAEAAAVHHIIHEQDEVDQYYGEDELTEAEKELAMKPEQRAVYTELLPE
ncbi:hypothetical protein D3C81_2005730 [compost metagenome]